MECFHDRVVLRKGYGNEHITKMDQRKLHKSVTETGIDKKKWKVRLTKAWIDRIRVTGKTRGKTLETIKEMDRNRK